MEEREILIGLISKLACGDNSALSTIYEMLGGRLYHIALGIMCNKNAANDVLQDSLIAIARGASKFRHDKNPYGYLCKIVNNTAINYLKKERRGRGVDLDSIAELPATGNIYEEIENTDSVATALNSLQPQDRRMVMLKYYSQLTVREIASIVKTSKSAVQRSLDGAEKILRNILQEVEV